MPRPEIVLIAAIAEKNRVIGKDGKLPWYISQDLKRFKRLTIGHPVVMGRKTFESILQRLGKPLAERRNIVLTSNRSFHYPEVETFGSIEAALEALSDEPMVFIIGGESVYEKTFRLADRLELTIVEGDYEGDAFFPAYQHLIGERFQLVDKEEREGYFFETYKRSH